MSGRPVPNAELAQVPPAKLRDYALNPHHPDGSHKARVFASALGITQTDWLYLAEQLRAGVVTAAVTGEKTDKYGTRYEVPIEVGGLNGRVLPVITAWFVPRESNMPRLVSAYVGVENR